MGPQRVHKVRFSKGIVGSGVEVTPVQARTVADERVARINVGTPAGARPKVAIQLKDSAAASSVVEAPPPRRRLPADTGNPVIDMQNRAIERGGNVAFFLDGVRVDSATIHNLDRERIEGIAAIKGPTTRAL